MSSSMYGCSVLVDSSLDGWIGEIQVPTSYGRILIDISKTVPDGVVGFFPSYEYMELVLNVWKENHLLEELQRSKLLFIETSDGVESSLALQHFRTACDVGVSRIIHAHLVFLALAHPSPPCGGIRKHV